MYTKSESEVLDARDHFTYLAIDNYDNITTLS
jgi:hypothetical protein